jgi:hypothetical protein
VPGDMLSMITGYAVSGHVPVEVVSRLLKERRAIEGITLPWCPLGSPGMPGAKAEPLTIHSFAGGKTTVDAVE